jgi:hypothetical protein
LDIPSPLGKVTARKLESTGRIPDYQGDDWRANQDFSVVLSDTLESLSNNGGNTSS